MGRVRQAAVAGYFYPADSSALRQMVDELLAGDGAGAGAAGGAAEGVSAGTAAAAPKALIAPHAGYVYSGSTAGVAYAQLARASGAIRRVLLLGPSHRVPFRGLALTRADAYATPLGRVPLDREACRAAEALPQVGILDQAHVPEHSLEVHLPFLQRLLGEFELIPIVVGDAPPRAVSEVIDALWGDEETLVVVSTDLSHYLDYDTARRVDAATTRRIEALEPSIRPEQACGCRPLNGLLYLAGQRDLGVRTLKLCNSGDTAGTRDRVVGYGAYAVT